MARTEKTVVSRARSLRREPTEAERRLWTILRDRQIDGARFRRQHPVGRYVLDFACVTHRLAVEADGGQHADSHHDARRDAFLRARGWRVLRVWNNDILSNLEGVRGVIALALAEERADTGPHPDPPPASLGEGEKMDGPAPASLGGVARVIPSPSPARSVGEGRGGGMGASTPNAPLNPLPLSGYLRIRTPRSFATGQPCAGHME